MDTLQFLKRVLPSEGVYVTTVITDGVARQGFFTEIEELAKAVLKSDELGSDAYYSVSSYQTKKNRKQENVHLTKLVAMDIDCGKNKPYPTWKEGLVALGKFIQDLNMPAPMIVQSGNGIHVYWSLTEALRPAEWKPLAEAVKACALGNGLHIDPVVTSDMVRILRPVGTHNHKDKTPKEVKLLLDAPDVDADTLRNAVMSYMAHPVIHPPHTTGSKLLENLAVKSEFPLSNAQTVKSKCQQLQFIVDNRADKTKVSEIMWYRAMGVAAFCHNAEEVAIQWSEGHPDFDPQAAVRKMEQWRSAATGPTTCDKFEEANPNGCKGCKFKDKIGSPIRLGVQYQEAEISQDVLDQTAYEVELPKPFKRTDSGIKCTIDDTDIDVCPFDLYPVGYGKDESLGYEVVRYHWKRPHIGWQPLTMRQAYLTDGSREFAGAVADQGIVLNSKKQTEYFQIMLRSYMDKLRQQRTMTNLYSTMGWKNNYTEWVMGDTILRREKNGSVQEQQIVLSSSSQRLGHDLYGTMGTLEEWHEFTTLALKADMPAHMLALIVSLSSPFYAFTGLKSTVVSLYGPTGCGKTLAQLWAQSIWGDPTKLHFAAKYTQNALFSRFALYAHMPLTVDETTLMDVKDVGDFLYWVTQGRDKARLTRTSEERESKEWAAPSIISTNKSMGSKLVASGLETTAQMARLLEVNLDSHRLFQDGSSAGREIYNFVATHYGVAGRTFLNKLLELGPDTIKAMIDDSYATFNKRYSVKFSGDERFWEQAIVLADLAGRLGYEWGILSFKPKHAIEWVLTQIGAMRKNVADYQIDAFDMMSEFLNDNAGAALTVMHTGDTKPTPDMQRIPRGEVRVRFDIYRTDSMAKFDRGTVMVDRTFFRKWLSKRGYDYKTFMEEINSQNVNATPKSGKASLGKDTPVKLPQCYTLGVNLNHPRLQGILEDADEVAENLTLGKIIAVQ